MKGYSYFKRKKEGEHFFMCSEENKSFTVRQRNDGIINLDSAFGKELGFISDKFEGWLWKTGNRITVSFIVSKQPNEGNLSRLFKTINDLGFKIAVPTPFALMKEILKKKGFTETKEWDEDYQDYVEIWIQE